MTYPKKPWFYLLGAAVLILLIKYSDVIFHSGLHLISILMPLLLGGAIAYVLNILVDKVELLPPFSDSRHPVYPYRRAVSIIASLAIIAIVVVVLVRIIIPQLTDAFRVILAGVPPMLEQLLAWVSSMDIPVPQIQEWLTSLNVNWPQLVQKIASYLSSGMTNLFTTTVSVVGAVSGVVVQLVMSFIFALYLLTGKEKLARQFQALGRTYLNQRVYRSILYVLDTAHDTFTKFIVGQCTEAVIIGVLCTLGMMLLRFPYATMIGTLIGATALLPIVGAYLGAVIGAFMIFTVNPLQSATFLVFIVILQQLEGNLIYPRVVGSSIGLPGIWVLTAVTVGGGIAGIPGMLLAVPLTATLYKLLRQDVARRQPAVSESSPTEPEP